VLKEKFEEFESLPRKRFPGLDTIVFIKMVFILFPASDYRYLPYTVNFSLSISVPVSELSIFFTEPDPKYEIVIPIRFTGGKFIADTTGSGCYVAIFVDFHKIMLSCKVVNH
jgi:hypothetical protein